MYQSAASGTIVPVCKISTDKIAKYCWEEEAFLTIYRPLLHICTDEKAFIPKTECNVVRSEVILNMFILPYVGFLLTVIYISMKCFLEVISGVCRHFDEVKFAWEIFDDKLDW